MIINKIPKNIRIVLFVLLIPIISILICSSISDSHYNKALLIKSLQTSKGVDFLSAYIKEDYEYSNYYNANAFYKVQQIASYWNYEEKQTNTMFFRYREKDDICIFSLKPNDNTTIETTLLVPLSKNPINRFKLNLLAGTEKKKIDKECFETIYISESIADKLAASYGYSSTNKLDNYNKLLERDDLLCEYNKITSKNVCQQNNKLTKIAGVVDSSSLGVLESFCENDYVFVSWTTDLQLNICCPELIVLFLKDKIQNSIYLKELEFLNQEGSKWHYYFSDTNGYFSLGSLDEKIRNVGAKQYVSLTILSVLLLACLAILSFSLSQDGKTIKRLLFFGGIFIQFLTIIVILVLETYLGCSVNLWNSPFLILTPLVMFAVFSHKKERKFLEVTI